MRPDATLFLAINSLAGYSPALDFLMIFFAEILIYFIPAIIFALWHRKNNQWKPILWGTLTAFSISSILSLLLNLPRPGAWGLGSQLTVHGLDGAFPSDHTAFMFGAASSARKNKKLFRLLLMLGTLTGLARIFIGVHFPLDILGGAMLGFAIPIILDRVARWV
ncbi:MAG: phosphatase PAP2 family protein [Candidatus Altiarchaeota archaeon]|nr:phosphatase PAP2 family protein [Candidatus Altiarchaeota archaeon]